MMGRQTVDQSQLFYLFNLEARIPAHHLLRRINPTVTRILAGLRERLEAFYSEIGRPSIDPELMIRMLIVGYCYGIRSERRICEEVELHLAYRWFCRLDLDDKVPDHSTFSVNRHGLSLLKISKLTRRQLDGGASGKMQPKRLDAHSDGADRQLPGKQ
jgi:transposase